MQNDNAKLKIVTGKNNLLLRKKATPIATITPDLLALIEDMAVTMKESDGIGLAASQVGKSIALFVVGPLAFDRERSKWEFRKIAPPDVAKPVAFINPSISSYPKGEDGLSEGCLSLPGWEGSVKRSKRITIKAQALGGQIFKLQAKGLLARVLQHEYDHLQGILICDRWEKSKKIPTEEKMRTADRYTLRKEKIVFFGDSEYSQIVFKALAKTPFKPNFIVPTREALDRLDSSKKYALGILAFYGAILPRSLITQFRFGILNIHPSLLPRYRGPSPVQQTIINGDQLTGVSIMLLNPKLDSGDILAQQEFVVDKAYSTPQLHHILFTMGASLLVEVIPQWLYGSLIPKKQDESEATYTPLLKKEDGLIHWRQDATVIERKVRAYQPWPTAYTFFNHRGKVLRLQILEATVQNLTTKSEPGKLEATKRELIVHCGNGTLAITKLRPEGKKEMTGEEFLRGYEVEKFFSNVE